MGRGSFLIAFALLCGACAPVSRLPALSKDAVAAEQRREQIAHIKDYYAQIHRVDTVGFRLRTANVEFCRGWVSAQIGLYAATPQSLPRRYRSYSAEALNLTWARPTVISVVDGSPAAQAGIVVGDEVTALDGDLIPVTGTAGWMAGWLKRHGATPVKVNVQRDGVDRAVTVKPVIGCAIPVYYVFDDTVNAATSNTRIEINSGIVALARTDSQLAAIIGHEMAHWNLGHLDKRRFNTLLATAGGAALDLAILSASLNTGGAFTREFGKAGALAFSVGFEREADYVGAYYAARAGYDLTGVEEFWYAAGQHNPRDITIATTHPTSPVRILQMREVAAEIVDKKRRHLPLVPELKSHHPRQEPTAAEHHF